MTTSVTELEAVESAGTRACPLCRHPSSEELLAEGGWVPEEVAADLERAQPGWRRADGACPACVQAHLLRVLLVRGENAFHDAVQRAWPIDPEAAYGLLPTPLRLHADPRLTGRGVVLALVDASFYPHADLVRPTNRIRAWADAGAPVVVERRFGPDEVPRWPRWEAYDPGQWHGLMTSAVAAGNGHASHGLYRGLASAADLVLVQVRDAAGRIGGEAIARALRWLLSRREELHLGVVSVSLGGEAAVPLADNPVDAAVADLEAAGTTVVVAAGNDGIRRLVPPATSPRALTVGGLDDRELFSDEERRLWHSNYGSSASGRAKPDLVAPSLRVVAPLLPGTELATEARQLFARRAAGDARAEARIAEARLVTPRYQHVEGTSFAAPIVAGAAACLLEARPGLRPADVRRLLLEACTPVPGAEAERQGAGALDAGLAARRALGAP